MIYNDIDGASTAARSRGIVFVLFWLLARALSVHIFGTVEGNLEEGYQ